MLTIRFQGPAEAVEKLKVSQDKIKSKVLAKLPSAHNAQVILRDKPVNASSGAFYGGFIYGEDKEGKKVKCGEVRVKTSSLGKVTPSKEVKKVEKTTKSGGGKKGIDELLKSKDFSIEVKKFFVEMFSSERSFKNRRHKIIQNTFYSYVNPTRKGKFINVKLEVEYWVEIFEGPHTERRAGAIAHDQCRWSFHRGSSFSVGGYKLTLSNFAIIKNKAKEAGSGYYDADYIADVTASVDFEIS